MCSPSDLATLMDAMAARTRIEMELATLVARLNRYDTAPEVLQALKKAVTATADTKTHQSVLYRRMAEAHKARITP